MMLRDMATFFSTSSSRLRVARSPPLPAPPAPPPPGCCWPPEGRPLKPAPSTPQAALAEEATASSWSRALCTVMRTCSLMPSEASAASTSTPLMGRSSPAVPPEHELSKLALSMLATLGSLGTALRSSPASCAWRGRGSALCCACVDPASAELLVADAGSKKGVDVDAGVLRHVSAPTAGSAVSTDAACGSVSARRHAPLGARRGCGRLCNAPGCSVPRRCWLLLGQGRRAGALAVPLPAAQHQHLPGAFPFLLLRAPAAEVCDADPGTGTSAAETSREGAPASSTASKALVKALSRRSKKG